MHYPESIQEAILLGDWESIHPMAQQWVASLEQSGTEEAPTEPRAYFALNLALLLRGDVQGAFQAHARSLQESQDIARVRTWVDSIQERHPENAGVQLVVGLFLSQSGQSEASQKHYQEAIRLDPTVAYPHFFLAQIHERAGRIDLALKEYREAVKLQPSHALARTNLGVLYQEQGRLEMAIPQYREVLKLNPSDAVAHANLACALAEQGKLEPALQTYKEAIRLNPADPELRLALGGIYETKGRQELAMQEYREATRLAPSFSPAETALGWIFFHKGKRGMAMDAFNRALGANPEDASAIFGLARVYAGQFGRQKIAQDHYMKAMKLEKDPEKKTAIMNHMVKEGNLEG